MLFQHPAFNSGSAATPWSTVFFILACAIANLLFANSTALAQVNVSPLPTQPVLRTNPARKSLKDIRDQGLVRQQYDFSCGAAALATIFRYGYGDDVTEIQVLRDLYGLLSEEEQDLVRESGFSLLHLQQVALSRDYRAGGFRLEPGQLSLLNGPVIVYIEPRGYRHFAVLRGVRGDRVYLADPSRGNIRMPTYQFLESWVQEDGTGIIFVVEPNDGASAGNFPLTLPEQGYRQPQMMSARELLSVGNPAVRWPELAR